MKMQSVREHRFGDKTMKPGDTFEANDRESAWLQVLGWAKPAEEARRSYRRRDMTAQ